MFQQNSTRGLQSAKREKASECFLPALAICAYSSVFSSLHLHHLADVMFSPLLLLNLICFELLSYGWLTGSKLTETSFLWLNYAITPGHKCGISTSMLLTHFNALLFSCDKNKEQKKSVLFSCMITQLKTVTWKIHYFDFSFVYETSNSSAITW